MTRCFAVFLAVVMLVRAQGTKPHDSIKDYEVHTAIPGANIGADYLSRSIPLDRGVVDAQEFLVVEVAVFPLTGSGPALSSDNFMLHVNGKDIWLHSQATGLVASSLRTRSWDDASVGDSSTITGRGAERFPGDPNARGRYPSPPGVPSQDGTGMQKPPPLSLEEALQRSALPATAAKGPTSGYLFFPFKGKTKSIRSLELVYMHDDPSRSFTLRLF